MLLFSVLVICFGWLLLYLFGQDFKETQISRIKWIIAYVYIWILKRKLGTPFDFSSRIKDVRRAGLLSTPDARTKELPRPLQNDINAADTVGIWGVDNHGNALITRLARRHDRRTDVTVYMKLASGEEYQLPIQPDNRVYDTNGTTFSAAGLTYEVLEPLRTWRVTFNGILRKGTRSAWSDSNDDCICVKFNFIWHPMYSYMVMPNDVNISNLATTMAKMKWTRDFILNSTILPKERYEQCGELHGTVQIEQKDEFTMLLRGQKDRRNGVDNFSLMKKGISIKGVLKNGLTFHVYGNEIQDGLTDYVQGYVTPPSNFMVHSISKCLLDIPTVVKNVDDPQDIVLHFVANDREYLLLSKENNFAYSVYDGDNWDYKTTTKLVTLKLNGKEGYGLVEYMQPHNGTRPLPSQKSLPQLSEPQISETSKLIVSFKERECQSSKVVGGKGSSLALLTSLSQEEIENFIVPAGLCVTNEAFKNHLTQNPNLKNTIKTLEDVAWKRKDGSIKEECKNVMEAMHATEMSSELRESLKQQLAAEFGNKIEDMRFAIRSSAIGEDSEELSAAGQNETYLGVKGIKDIELAIVKCWASQFSFRSIEYKRQYGQLLNGGMGVVIQSMVPSDVAGVLFTRDPQSGSPAYMTITSNYGLGESVVSAAADPDTIILKRTWNDKLTVHRKDIGKKNMKITMSENGGTLESDINSEDSSRCTLSDEMALKLGEIAINLERRFGSARDNEWAVHKNQIYLLQSRPVTSDKVLTEFEVHHEFNTTSNTDNESYTTANIQEVMPGALTPLTVTGSGRAMGIGFLKTQMYKHLVFRYDPTITEIAMFYNHSIFNRIQQKSWNMETEKSAITKAMELGFYGRVIEDDGVLEIALERYEKPPLAQRMLLMSMSVPGMLYGPLIMRRAERNLRNYHIPIAHTTDPEEAYKIISEHILNIENFVNAHMKVTMASTVWNLILLNILSKGSGEFDMSIYSDFATLIGSNNGTESGGVPFGLQELTHAISEEIEAATFVSMPKENALTWIQEGKGPATEKFHEFLKCHGHRGFKEFEMQTVTWGMDPVKLVLVLQNMLKKPLPIKKVSKGTSVKDALNEMKTNVVGFQRKLLALFVYIGRTYVCYREQAKSMMINFENCLRISYRHLAKLMVESGYIPDPELLFFLTNEEIDLLLQTRSPRYIMRAKQRQRQYNFMDSIIFPEMFAGIPKPANPDDVDNKAFEGATQVKGYPACSGVIQGTARVIRSFDEVDSIEPGDILITYSTDIGWSPYFPMLSGVVTEIGGLISHGAVVAREYGLPCLIAAENATKIFKSGDTVRLDATKGVLLKVE